MTSGQRWFYLSFATETQFLGGAIVAGDDMVSATMNAYLIGINPGGQVAGIEIPEAPPAHWRARLLSKADLEEFDREMGV